jgi:hypothetical protein
MRRKLVLPGLLLLCACGVSAAEHGAVIAERDSLQSVLASALTELEELKFGAERLLALASASLADGELEAARSHAMLLVERHPGAAERPEAERIRVEAERRIAEREERARREREAAEHRARAGRERALAAARSTYDDIRGITWYRHRSSPEYVNTRSDIHLYVGKTDAGFVIPRLRILYKADNWLFIRSYLIKADDQTFVIAPDAFEVERDHGYSGIWEWYDTPATARELEILRTVAESRRAVIRYQGQQYHRDRTITDREKQAIREMLIVHDNLRSM